MSVCVCVCVFSAICDWGSPRSVVANMLDSDIIESEFELQACYYVHFRTNNIVNDVNPVIPINYGLDWTERILNFYKDSKLLQG